MKTELEIAARYAEAVFQAARKKGDEEKVLRDLKGLHEAIGPSGLGRFLESPRFFVDQKKKILEKLQTHFESPLSGALLVLLLRKSRLGLLGAIARSYERMNLALRNEEQAEVISAGPVSESFKKKLLSTLTRVTGLNLSLVFRRNPSLVGGFVVRIGHRMIDASLWTRLEVLKKQLLQTQVI